MRSILFCLLLFFIACGKGDLRRTDNILIVTHSTPLLAAPGPGAKEIALLPERTKLIDLDEVSAFASQIWIENTSRCEPWLKVKTKDGREGWVFAAAARPETDDETIGKRWLFLKRMECYFGKTLTNRWYAWANADREQASEMDFAADFRECAALRDTFNIILSRVITPGENAELPDMFWLGDHSRYWQLQRIEGDTRYFIFLNYLDLSRSAARTQGRQDDLFAEACLAAFAPDSIESFFPSWMIQTDENEACSRLGTGVHLKMLKLIDRSAAAGDIFARELKNLKESVVADILGGATQYWQPQTDILEEMNAILSASLDCLDEQDLLALTERLKVLEQAEANGILLNRRAGTQ